MHSGGRDPLSFFEAFGHGDSDRMRSTGSSWSLLARPRLRRMSWPTMSRRGADLPDPSAAWRDRGGCDKRGGSRSSRAPAHRVGARKSSVGVELGFAGGPRGGDDRGESLRRGATRGGARRPWRQDRLCHHGGGGGDVTAPRRSPRAASPAASPGVDGQERRCVVRSSCVRAARPSCSMRSISERAHPTIRAAAMPYGGSSA